MSFSLILLLSVIAYAYLNRKAQLKRQADLRNWGVDYHRRPGSGQITGRLPWKELS